MIKKKSAYITLIALAVVFELFIYSASDSESQKAVNIDHYKISAFEIKDDVDFCGEKVPLHSQDILERYEREVLKNAHWHSEIILLYKRSGKYFPLIERILAENNIPDDFKYLCVIESGLANVVSPVGASGFWQIMEKTGKEYGLEINRNVDERYHLEKATRVACEYFKRSYKKFGSWTLVAASYNMGISGVAKRLKRQKVNSYYDLLINAETSRYVFRILALKQILTNPDQYNFNFSNCKKYEQVPMRYVVVDSSVANLIDWSLNESINYKILKIYNPWLKSKRLPNEDSTMYTIAIPKESIIDLSTSSVVNTDSAFSVESTEVVELQYPTDSIDVRSDSLSITPDSSNE
jgi:membrane-bound lytic murein transglycosylase D